MLLPNPLFVLSKWKYPQNKRKKKEQICATDVPVVFRRAEVLNLSWPPSFGHNYVPFLPMCPLWLGSPTLSSASAVFCCCASASPGVLAPKACVLCCVYSPPTKLWRAPFLYRSTWCCFKYFGGERVSIRGPKLWKTPHGIFGPTKPAPKTAVLPLKVNVKQQIS